MSKWLFSNVGRDIKVIAKVIANWILGLHILLGIVFIICGCALLSEGLTIGLVGFLIAVGLFISGYHTSKLAVMLLYAYGEITDRLISIDSKVSDNPKSAKSDKILNRVEAAERRSDVSDQLAAQEAAKASSWTCVCGRSHPLYVSTCVCGVTKAETKKNATQAHK